MDVSARSAADPVADRLLANIAKWAGEASPAVHANATYVGDESTRTLLGSLGAQLTEGGLPTQPSTGVFVVGPGIPADRLRSALSTIRESGATFVFLFQSLDNLKARDPIVAAGTAKIVGDAFEPATPAVFQGIGAAELHLRARTLLAAIATAPQGWRSTHGAIAAVDFGKAKLVFLQLDPRAFDSSQPGRIYVKLTRNRISTLLSRVLANAGVSLSSPLLDHWS
jgi:hypothetical protein